MAGRRRCSHPVGGVENDSAIEPRDPCECVGHSRARYGHQDRTMSGKNPAKPKHTAAQRITPEQQETWFALLFTRASVTDRIDRDLQEQHGISFSATEILCRLHDEEPRSVRALADQLVSVSPTRASRLAQELVDAGYLQRGADQGD